MSSSSRTATFVLCAVTSLFVSGGVAAQQPPAPPPIPAPAPAPTPVPAPPPIPVPAPAPPPVTVPAAAPALAQPESRPAKVAPEARVDGIIATLSAFHAGAGFTVTVGTYLRTGVLAGAGFSRDGLSGRLDGIARFHFDPLRQSRWAPYGGGGLSGRFDRGEKARAYLMLLLGLDGPIYSGVTPSFEVGLGGGARVGVIVRRAAAERR